MKTNMWSLAVLLWAPLVAAQSPSEAPSEVTLCSIGIPNKAGSVCCAAGCEVCGECNCAERGVPPFDGPSFCCPGAIQENGVECTLSSDVGCILGPPDDVFSGQRGPGICGTPSENPSAAPSSKLVVNPVVDATRAPSVTASDTPSAAPSMTLSEMPSAAPSPVPSSSPSFTPRNEGSDFVLAFARNIDSTNLLFLYITGELGNCTVSIPGIGFQTSVNVIPGTVSTVSIPITADVEFSDTIENKGISISATGDIVVYGLSQREFTSDAFLGLPVNVLGTEYITLGYRARTSSAAGASLFAIVAPQDNTTVRITPSATTSGRVAGVPYSITLNELDVYQLLSDTTSEDLTGSLIQSDKPVSVFGGGACLNVPTSRFACDHIIEQMPPTDTWATSFFLVPLAQRRAGDIFRVLAREDNTTVLIDGIQVAVLNARQNYETILVSTDTHEIQTSKPCLVAQYNQGSSADGVQTDPFQLLIPPAEQYLDSYTLTTPAATPVSFTNFVNVVVLSSDLAACTLDGGTFNAAVTSLGFLPIGATGFVGGQLAVAIGVHNLDCPSPFGAFAYGSFNFDSYGYPGGMALRTTGP